MACTTKQCKAQCTAPLKTTKAVAPESVCGTAENPRVLKMATEAPQTFHDPAGSKANYKNNRECFWLIEGPANADSSPKGYGHDESSISDKEAETFLRRRGGLTTSWPVSIGPWANM